MSLLTYYKYKIIEFTPEQNMEETFKNLGEDGWELVSVVPIGLKIEGRSDMTSGYGDGEINGAFEKIAAYFKKTM